MAFYQIKKEQIVKRSVEEVWGFISDPANLKVITPEAMGFEITSEPYSGSMYPGMIIGYKVSPLLGLRMTWVTEITQIKEHAYFVDEQRIGPYKMWHHEHILTPHTLGTKMTDIVSYQPPFGVLGKIANGLIIKRELARIFDFRFQKMNELFG
jgi:ligand-binding SRPBCC domain-containing protein